METVSNGGIRWAVQEAEQLHQPPCFRGVFDLHCENRYPVSKPAVSPISNRQNRRQFRGFRGGEAFAGWKPALQQVWKPLLRGRHAKHVPSLPATGKMPVPPSHATRSVPESSVRAS